jgi:hypothetical protein
MIYILMTKITEKDIPPPPEKQPKKQKPKHPKAETVAPPENSPPQEPVHDSKNISQEQDCEIEYKDKESETLVGKEELVIQKESSEDLIRKYEEVLERLNKQVAEPVKPKVKKRPKKKPQVRIVEQWNEPQVVQAIATNSNERLYRQIFYRRK